MEEKLALSQSELQQVKASIKQYESLLDSYKVQVCGAQCTTRNAHILIFNISSPCAIHLCLGRENQSRGRWVWYSTGSGGAWGPGSAGGAGEGNRGSAQGVIGAAGRDGASSWSFTTLWAAAAGSSGQGAQPGETQQGAQHNSDWSTLEGHSSPVHEIPIKLELS